MRKHNRALITFNLVFSLSLSQISNDDDDDEEEKIKYWV